MSALRELLSDLVERRLWPVALLLVAGLVAVPVLVAKHRPSAPSADAGSAALQAAAAAAQAPTPAGDAIVSVAAPDTHNSAPLRGRAKDPFRQQHVPPTPSTGASTASGATGAGAGAGGPTPGTGDAGGAVGPPAQHPTGKVYVRPAIDVRFGKAGHTLRTIDDVPRLTPLPGDANPVVIFLGVRKDLKTAVFMISSDVHARGDATCVPSKDDCEAIEMKEGGVALLDVAGANGVTKQYELDLVKVTLKQTTSKAAAQAAYARVSRKGARLMRRRDRAAVSNLAADGTRPPAPLFRYAWRRGVLHIAPRLSARARARRAAR